MGRLRFRTHWLPIVRWWGFCSSIGVEANKLRREMVGGVGRPLAHRRMLHRFLTLPPTHQHSRTLVIAANGRYLEPNGATRPFPSFLRPEQHATSPRRPSAAFRGVLHQRSHSPREDG